MPSRADVRPPLLTGAVFVLTAVVSVAGDLAPAVLEALRRDGALISAGQLWRPFTSLLVQDGGWFGTVTNLIGLAVLGALLEQVCGRGRWLLAYLGAGLVGEVAGWAGWQPVGAGNSVAVCGLAAMLAVVLARRGGPWVFPGGAAVTIWTSWLVMGVLPTTPVLVACVVLVLVIRATGFAWTAVVVAAIAAAILLLRADIHGAALGAGLVIAAGCAVGGGNAQERRTRARVRRS